MEEEQEEERPLYVPDSAWQRYNYLLQQYGDDDVDVKCVRRLIFDLRMKEVFSTLAEVLSDERDWHRFFMLATDARAFVDYAARARKDISHAADACQCIADLAYKLADKLDFFWGIRERSGLKPSIGTIDPLVDLMDLLAASNEHRYAGSFRNELLPAFERATRLVSSRARFEMPRPGDLARTIAQAADSALTDPEPFKVDSMQLAAALGSRKGSGKDFKVRDYILNLDHAIDKCQRHEPSFHSCMRSLKHQHRASAILAVCALDQEHADIRSITQAVKQLRARVTIRHKKTAES
jgi:hypothetical protein